MEVTTEKNSCLHILCAFIETNNFKMRYAQMTNSRNARAVNEKKMSAEFLLLLQNTFRLVVVVVGC